MEKLYLIVLFFVGLFYSTSAFGMGDSTEIGLTPGFLPGSFPFGLPPGQQQQPGRYQSIRGMKKYFIKAFKCEQRRPTRLCIARCRLVHAYAVCRRFNSCVCIPYYN